MQFAIAPQDRHVLHERIEQRFHKMIELGFQAEVEKLYARGDLNINLPSIRCVGYRQMWEYLQGDYAYEEMIFRGICATRQLAKRQITWLRGWKTPIQWLDSLQPQQAKETVLRHLDSYQKVRKNDRTFGPHQTKITISWHNPVPIFSRAFPRKNSRSYSTKFKSSRTACLSIRLCHSNV